LEDGAHQNSLFLYFTSGTFSIDELYLCVCPCLYLHTQHKLCTVSHVVLFVERSSIHFVREQSHFLVSFSLFKNVWTWKQITTPATAPLYTRERDRERVCVCVCVHILETKRASTITFLSVHNLKRNMIIILSVYRLVLCIRKSEREDFGPCPVTALSLILWGRTGRNPFVSLSCRNKWILQTTEPLEQNALEEINMWPRYTSCEKQMYRSKVSSALISNGCVYVLVLDS